MPMLVVSPSGPAFSASGRWAALTPAVKLLYEVDWVETLDPDGGAATSLTIAASGWSLLIVALPWKPLGKTALLAPPPL